MELHSQIEFVLKQVRSNTVITK